MARGLLRRLTLTIGLLAAGPAGAVDVTGSWQANLDCGYYAVATSFLQLTQDAGTGAVDGVGGPGCGTAEISGGPGIQEIGSCQSTPAVISGMVAGTSLSLPTSGFYTSDALMATPFFYPLLGCTVARIIVDNRYTGTVTAQVGDLATRVEGVLHNGAVEFRRPDDSVCFAIPDLLDCTFTLLRNEVATGSNVTVAPSPDVSVTFEAVTAPGTAAATALTTPAASVPADFQLYANQGLPIFYDVSTTSTFTGAITTCVRYPDANDDGYVDGVSPAMQESDLRILHEEGAAFVDRTASLDPLGNVICAETTNLSQVAFGAPAGAPPAFTDRPILADKLVVRRTASGNERMAFVARALILTPTGGSADDPRLVGATVELISDTEGVQVFDAFNPFWQARQESVGFVGSYRYTGPLSLPLKKVVIKAGTVLRAKARALDLPLAGPHGGMAVRVTTGSLRHCARFSGPGVVQVDEAGRFIATDAPPNALPDCSDAALGIGSPSGAFVD